MKKILITSVLALCGTVAFSQSVSDALTFGVNDYEGSARTVAMGNAFTAVGGDLGAISINPAGAAVARVSQFSVTPSAYLSVNTAQGSLLPDGTAPFGKKIRSRDGRLGCSNVGFSLNFNTGRNRGLKNWTVGLVWNSTQTFADGMYAQGTNYTTSFTGSLASDASGILQDGNYDGYNSANMSYDSGIPYNIVAAYKAGLISNLPGTTTGYVGAAENLFEDGSASIGKNGLEQYMGRRIRGNKKNAVMNFGFNFSDIVYFGVNAGYNNLNYKSEEYLREDAVELSDVVISYGDGRSYNFSTTKRNYAYKADATGFDFKLGLIVTPVAGLRLGVALGMPSLYKMTESIDNAASLSLLHTDSSTSASDIHNTEKAPTQQYKYWYRSPLEANFGVAYTFGRFALVSLDYEVCDYSTMRFTSSSSSSDGYDDFADLNSELTKYAGTAHYLRTGFELRPLNWLSVRGGYNLATSPEYSWNIDTEKKERLNGNIHTASLGVGFTTSSGWFFDLAAKTKWYRDEYIIPYSDYVFQTDADGNYLVDGDGMKIVNSYTPEIVNRKRLFSFFFTFGLKW